MRLRRNKLYLLLSMTCIAGYIWIYYGMISGLAKMEAVGGCIIKHATNIPCPSCGATRAVLSLIKGNFIAAFYLNPIGYIIALIMVMAPLWILMDLIAQKNSLFDFYCRLELHLKKVQYALPLIVLVIINWIWNISKGL